MTLDELLAALDHKSPPAPIDALKRFEATIGQPLPDDYREFLVRCNGRAYASRVPQNRAATKDFFEKMAVEGRCEPFLGDAQFLWMRLQQRQRQAA